MEYKFWWKTSKCAYSIYEHRKLDWVMSGGKFSVPIYVVHHIHAIWPGAVYICTKQRTTHGRGKHSEFIIEILFGESVLLAFLATNRYMPLKIGYHCRNRIINHYKISKKNVEKRHFHLVSALSWIYNFEPGVASTKCNRRLT